MKVIHLDSRKASVMASFSEAEGHMRQRPQGGVVNGNHSMQTGGRGVHGPNPFVATEGGKGSGGGGNVERLTGAEVRRSQDCGHGT